MKYLRLPFEVVLLLGRAFYVLLWVIVHERRKVTFVAIDWFRVPGREPMTSVSIDWNARTLVQGRVMTISLVEPRDIYVRSKDGAECVRLADRGVTWCYGWEGEAVDALRAVVGLS